VEAKKGEFSLLQALVSTLSDPWGTSWISSAIDDPKIEREFGLLMYKTPNVIIYYPESAIVELDKKTPILALDGEAPTHSVKKNDPISGCLYKEFSEYLSNAGINKPSKKHSFSIPY
jgi:hypothetical protein